MKIVDMALTSKESAEAAGNPMPMPANTQGPKYPYGLCLSLDEKSMEKLGLDTAEMPDLGDMIHFMAMAKVTSVSQNENESGKCCRIELQITHMGFEDEARESEEDRTVRRGKNRYGSKEEPEPEEEAESEEAEA